MLMTKFIFLVHRGENNQYHTVVTRLSDGAQKYFFQCGGTLEGKIEFMNSMTDELCEGYWPKKASGVDNWLFRGYGVDRCVAEILADADFCRSNLLKQIQNARIDLEKELKINVKKIRKELGW